MKYQPNLTSEIINYQKKKTSEIIYLGLKIEKGREREREGWREKSYSVIGSCLEKCFVCRGWYTKTKRKHFHSRLLQPFLCLIYSFPSIFFFPLFIFISCHFPLFSLSRITCLIIIHSGFLERPPGLGTCSHSLTLFCFFLLFSEGWKFASFIVYIY